MAKTYQKLNADDIKSHQRIKLLFKAFDMFVSYIKFQTNDESYYSLEKLTGISKLAIATLSSNSATNPSWNTFKKAVIYVAENDELFSNAKNDVKQIDEMIPNFLELQLTQDQIRTYSKELRAILDINWISMYRSLKSKYQKNPKNEHLFDRLDANKPLALFMYVTDHQLLNKIPSTNDSNYHSIKDRSLLIMVNYFLEFYPKEHVLDKSLLKQLSAIKLLNIPITKKQLGLKTTQLITDFYRSKLE